MKRMLSLLCAVLFTLSLVACGGGEEEPATLGQAIKQDFQAQGKADPDADLETLAQALLDNEALGFAPMVMPVEPGLLQGFGNTEIQGFSQGVMFGPAISTIPFLGYLFRLEEGTDQSAFLQTLERAADLQWNICTAADELVMDRQGDLVFFLMCPQSMEG